jgi:prepilin-type N-terminal cleavage/methylation domain-containing protein
MTATRRLLREQAGFTLTELLIACAMIGVVMAGLLSILTSGQQTYLVGSNQVEAQQELRLSIQRMTTELRNAGFCPRCGTGVPALAPFPAITNATATSFTLQNDLNGDWAGAGALDQIIYAFNAGTLTRREVGVDPQPVGLATLNALTFTYLDRNGNTLPTPVAAAQEVDIRTIVVNAVGQPQNQPSTFQVGRVTVAMTDTVRLRNRTP